MLNRRYLGWLIAGAYAAPQGGFRAPDAATLQPEAVSEAPMSPAPGIAFFATDAMHSSQGGHLSITARGYGRAATTTAGVPPCC